MYRRKTVIRMPKFLSSTPALVVTVFLLVQAAVMYSSIRAEVVPASRPLAGVPAELGGWRLKQEVAVEQDVQDTLKADDLLNRVYGSGPRDVSLFVAAFRTQSTGKAPHSPKNCLPGSGWEPLASGETSIDVGQAAPIVVNRYIISHGNDRALVLYWYQSRDRVVASEYRAKFWTVADSIRLNRTDTALVRVLVPVVDRDEDRASNTAAEFVRSFFGTLRQYLPA
jgi:EpsI family protein